MVIVAFSPTVRTEAHARPLRQKSNAAALFMVAAAVGLVATTILAVVMTIVFSGSAARDRLSPRRMTLPGPLLWIYK
ncbi:MAG: hypothetical protein M3505_01145 [Verrucomicrobiota bacterium]|nr:hypothetical protein [Verrucomicrobiota bacterium]